MSVCLLPIEFPTFKVWLYVYVFLGYFYINIKMNLHSNFKSPLSLPHRAYDNSTHYYPLWNFSNIAYPSDSVN